MLLFLSGRAPPGAVLGRPPENNNNIIIFFGSSYKKIASWENVPGGALPNKNNNIIIFPGSCMACTGLSWDVVGPQFAVSPLHPGPRVSECMQNACRSIFTGRFWVLQMSMASSSSRERDLFFLAAQGRRLSREPLRLAASCEQALRRRPRSRAAPLSGCTS